MIKLSLSFWLGIIQQGLLFGVMGLGIYLTFRVLNYADLSVEGTFTLGAAVVCTTIIKGFDPLAGTILAVIAGALAGTITGILHTRFKITPLLSGILTMTALYSINLRIMGKANISLLRQETLITYIQGWGLDKNSAVLVLGLLTAALVLIGLNYFLKTELGLALRATGDNEQMIRSLGVNTDLAKVFGLALSNALVALSGALIAQLNNFADANMGLGMLVIGLASVIIGEVLFGANAFPRALVAVVLGSTAYRLIIGIALIIGLPATDLKLVSAILVAIFLASPTIKARLKIKS
jgi:putative ABC transport system permease protein